VGFPPDGRRGAPPKSIFARLIVTRVSVTGPVVILSDFPLLHYALPLLHYRQELRAGNLGPRFLRKVFCFKALG
jgi:hypothetical protein